mmetsp:Transcript_4901/g.13669  ORF Transcript_4901/g.13669 Transcript_4901/m.13669 type:complete len:1418 (+) Transcript_4901:25-4278(+)
MQVQLVVGLRERYSHEPTPGVMVRVEVLEVPPPPVPPPPVMRKTEGVAHYMTRVIEHLVDWVVESHEQTAIEHITRDFELESDADGLIRVSLAPLSLVRVLTNAEGEFEEEEMVEDVEISEQPEQFVGFNFERKCHLETSLYDAVTNEALEGVRVQLVLLEDENQEVVDPPKVLLEEYSDSNGCMETLSLRAGSRVMVKVLEAPFYHLAPRYAPGGSDTMYFRVTGRHEAKISLPRKPRIKINVYDVTSGEEVMGVKFRVLVDRNLSRANQEVAHQLGTPQEAKSEFELQQMDSWGEEMYRCYSGSPDVHRLFVDTQCKVAVQIYPMWPFRIAPQMHVQYSGGVKGCSPFVFWIVRDPEAAAFWKKRDEVVHSLWDRDGTPLGPPWHHMARLQPIISSANAITALRPDLPRLRPGWHPEQRVKPGNEFDVFGLAMPAGVDSAAAAAEASNGSGRDAFLLDAELDPEADLRRRAIEHMRMGDPARLPIEERKLMQLLTLWGCFKHVKGTNCKCNIKAGSVNPFYISNPDPFERRQFVGEAGLKMENESGRLRIGDHSVNPDQYTAGEILKSIADNSRRKTPRLAAASHGLSEDEREAVYCDSPFFTLWMPDGQGIHVGVHDGLYRDLVLCMEKLGNSMKACDAQLAKIEAYNATRSTDGAYAYGNGVSKGTQGGVFLMDASAAMPPNGLSFCARQLGLMLEHWYTLAVDKAAEGTDPKVPLFNVVVASGNTVLKLSEQLREVNGKMMNIVPPWLSQQEDTTQVGFNLVRALKMALRLADGRVPIYVVTGGMSNGLNGFVAEEVFHLVEADFKGHIAAGEPVMPINSIEVQPVPISLLLNPKSSQWEQAQEQGMGGNGAMTRPGSGAGGLKSFETGNVGASVTGTAIQEDPFPQVGGDVFMRLALHISEGRTRLLEVFRQVNKKCDGKLDSGELGALLRRVLPNISSSQIRYLQVMLDNDGNDAISYRELAETIRICKRAGVAVKARDGVELVDILRKLAMKQIKEALTVSELFTKYDTTRSGFLEKVHVSRMLKALMPAASPSELGDMAEAFWAVDTNGDNRISREEFSRAMLRGGADALDLRSGGADQSLCGFDQEELAVAALQLKLMSANSGGKGGPKKPADAEYLAGGAASREEEADMSERGDGSAVRKLMFQLCSVTAGTIRSFDMGSAKAAAEYIDMGPIQATRNRLEEEYEKMAVFEKQYGGRVLIEKRQREQWREKRVQQLASEADGGSKPVRRSKGIPKSPSLGSRRRPQSAAPAVQSNSQPWPTSAPPDSMSGLERQRSSGEWSAPTSEASATRKKATRPTTAPARRSRDAPERPRARSLPTSRWQVSEDGRAVYTPGDGRVPAIVNVVQVGGDSLSLAGTAPPTDSAAGSQVTRGVRGSGFSSPPRGGGFRDPRVARPEPEESIYGLN